MGACFRILWLGFVCMGSVIAQPSPPQSHTTLQETSTKDLESPLKSHIAAASPNDTESRQAKDSVDSVSKDASMSTEAQSAEARTTQEQIHSLKAQIQQLQDEVNALKAPFSKSTERKRYGLFIGGGFGGLYVYDDGRGEDFGIVSFVLRAGYQHYFGFLGVRAYAESANGAEAHEREDIMHIGYVNLHSLNLDVMLDAHFRKFSMGVFGGVSQMWALYRNELQYGDGYAKFYGRHSGYLGAYNIGAALTWRQIHRVEVGYRIMPTQKDIKVSNMLTLAYQYVF
ncbi:FlxA-like family protein [uncultured Helicobacter sp.]|uniref:FlxA-like family protein n=1 Tax=uncultured Helicobacter sp. TaxID=175537 RepID=UPI00375376D2